VYKPNLDALPGPRRKLWRELSPTPADFVLYGGTALALRLRHRQSEDFDFFSNKPFVAAELREALPYLRQAEMTQFHDNTLTALVDRNGPVKVSFFGGLAMQRVHDPDVAEDNGIQIASLLDIAASKLLTVQQRAQAKDYMDIAAMIDGGIVLSEALAAAHVVHGSQFNGALSLKALTYFEDGDLPTLSRATRDKLCSAATGVNLRKLPHVVPKPGLTGGKRQEP
jgi:hypothetical protein